MAACCVMPRLKALVASRKFTLGVQRVLIPTKSLSWGVFEKLVLRCS